MKCVKCRSTSLPVLETRATLAGVYRRRRCKRCDVDLVTLEQPVNEAITKPRAGADKRVGGHR